MALLSVVIPARNEAGRLPGLLAQLAQRPQLVQEVLVVDGGSADATSRVAQLAGARLLRSPPGRGRQLALGAAEAMAPWLLLLHADVSLPRDWAERVQAAIGRGSPARGQHRERAWFFDLGIHGHDPALRLVELGAALRSRWRQLPYGDQGLLLSRRLYDAVGGIRPLPLMEDLDLVQRLRQRARLASLGAAVEVDGRRWRRLGVWRTTLANARLRRAWRRGAPAEVLVNRYYRFRDQGAYQKAQRRCSGSSSQPSPW
ncbi:TIGR04283 family arsenosugar biosynthesis glycosyltransferase [Cyanobium sp. CH-040]|uniref:TIGR04283 family arsenosugar biosynthesis glycosyltransferase n=1 Tax=Cyanobium sp. CH-040 TaxID=2823708 RepID=UPI0020CE9326|nr:TIGR04283 family arsenosugar biosynthesis glycosyltransferase [Cyanobium sp. CH-040]MCP9928190.1 TIGR04283 family arsenosugar biosynthesis glycosyltransferase [Cyanobium sp. CH-040]